MNIRTKLTSVFAGLALIVLVVAAITLSALSQASDRFAHYVTGISARTVVASHLRSAVDTRAIAARNLVLVSKPADLETEKAVVAKAHAEVGTLLQKLKTMIAAAEDATPRGRALVAEIDKIEATYGPVALAIVELASKGKRDEAITKMNEECRPLLAALDKASDEYASTTDARSKELIQEAQAAYGFQRNLLIVACLVAMAVAVTAGLLVTRSITGPMAQAVSFANAVAAGDLTATVDAKGKDEVSLLLTALGRMSQSLATIVREVRGSSDSIATGSAQIAAGNSDLSQRTEQSAGNLQQTASSLEELTATVRNSADGASQANQLAASASAVAVRGGEVVGQVVSTMDEINSSSKRIADIIGTIDAIAFQTNILALNAAVEAARAGEQGRGFAVVASEVRSLAQRSAEAAREIKALIGSSVERVEAGSRLVADAGSTMTEIVGSVQRVTDVINEISAAAREQSQGISLVNGAVNDLDQMTQQNAALVEQSAAAAESLRAQSQRLTEIVSVFRV